MARNNIEFGCAMCGKTFDAQTDVEDHTLQRHSASVRAMS